jgi:uncharacterized membrane protein
MDLIQNYEIPFLHPLVVHFPLVLLLLGAAAAGFYLLLGRGVWRRAAFILFVLGALSAWAAAETGPALADAVDDPLVEQIVDRHAAAAEWTVAASAFAAAFFALLSALALRTRSSGGEPAEGEAPPPRSREALSGRLLGFVFAAAAAVLVAWTAHLGGLMVWGVPR